MGGYFVMKAEVKYSGRNIVRLARVFKKHMEKRTLYVEIDVVCLVGKDIYCLLCRLTSPSWAL